MIVPEANIAAYQLLFAIENSLRGFIRTKLEESLGPRWFKARLPADLLSKYKDFVTWERKIPWQEFTPHHPLFYLDFPDLRKIIDRKDNWNDAFQPYFGDKTIFLGHLEALDFVRNRIAHNRYVQDCDVERLRVCLSMVDEGITHYGKPLLQDSFLGLDLPSRISRLTSEADSIFRKMKSFQSISTPSVWEAIRDQWWWDPDYLGMDTDKVLTFFRLVQDYRALPRVYGSGYLIEAWIKSNCVLDAFKSCESELRKCASR